MVTRAKIAAGAAWLLAMTLPVSAIETPEAAPEPIIEYLQKAGVSICIDSVSNFVEVLNRSASGYGAQITLPISPANEHMISISIEIELPDSTQYVSLTAAPVPSGGCEMNVETLSHGPCPESPGETASFLQRTIRLEENGRARRTYFMPLADGSCNIITKEVIY